jgi:Bacterial Ig-like domain (group 3)/IPT/TIG domain
MTTDIIAVLQSTGGRHLRPWRLTRLALLLLAALVVGVPAATATTGTFGGPLSSDPFAARSDGLAPAATPTRYEEAILADHPLMYLPLTETAGATAFDHSGNGLDGTYDLGVNHEGPGPLLDEPNVAALGEGQVVSQSGDKLPAGSEPRTVEFWIHDVASESFTPLRYGDIEGGHGFAVTLHRWTLTVEANGHSVSAATTDGFGRWCCDGTGWHMVDVTYDGTNADIYQDGQLIGSGTLGAAETEVPGQGLRLDTSYNACCGGAAPYGFAEAAVYPSVLSPEQIGAHWSAGASLHEESECASTPTGPYPKAVLEDSPLVYYRVGERAAYPTDRVAFDSSGHCDNGTLDLGATAGGGALTGDEDDAIFGEGQVVFQSGEELPAEAAPRTVEFWIHDVASESFTPLRYGDVEGGHGFAVTVHIGTLTVEAGGHSVSAVTADGFGHWCCDGTGWHMVDVTYDGTNADIYQDGQLIGSGPLPEVDTVTPGQGLRLDTSYNACCGGAAPYGLDEAAIYPSALTSAQIVAHWEAAARPPQGEAVIAGTARNGSGGRVQACPTSGEPCRVDRDAIDTSGAFHMLVPDGAYTVTIFPPAGSTDESKTIGPLELPPSDLTVDVAFSAPGGLPEGVSLSSPGRGTQEYGVPGLNWGEPSKLAVKACTDGFGIATVEGTNTSTGQSETRSSPLLEDPEDPGAYEASISPLAPIHGGASGTNAVICPQKLGLLPSGGPPTGGTTVLLDAPGGLTGATAVMFGTTPASSFKIITDDFIEAVAPPGSGSVAVTVTGGSGKTISVGTYTYLQVTSLSAGSGPASGGTSVTITGQGFAQGDRVLFGLVPPQSVTFVSSTELQAVAPPGIGTVDVQVVQGNSVSTPSNNALYAYQGGPAGTSGIDQSTVSPQAYPGDVAAACSVDVTPGVTLAEQDAQLCGAADFAKDVWEEGTGDLKDALLAPLTDEFKAFFSFGVANLFGDFSKGALAYDAIGAIGDILEPIAVAKFMVDIGNDVCKILVGEDCRWDFWTLFIDPSGTVVDTNGNPIGGATATLLDQPLAAGPFTKVEPSSGAIEPAENPEKTGPSGQFDWNALAGTYEVEASAPGCHAPSHPAQASVFTSPFILPPPAVGLVLTLECATAAAPVPKVTGLSVSGGSTAGGAVVDVLGENLAGVTTVHFGPNASVHVQPLSAYAVAAVAPAGTGTVDVTASGAGGTSATGESDRYAYSAPPRTESSPVVESVAPNSGPLSGGAVVTIKGSHLGGAFAVEFDGTSSTQVTPISANEVQATVPAAAFPERADVTVTTSAGSSAPTLADSFSYGSPTPPVGTAVTLTPSQSALPLGQSIVLKAVVAPTDGGGSVAFHADGSPTPLVDCGAQALAMKDGDYEASCSTSILAIGSHTLNVTYSGDASYAESSGATRVTVTHTAAEEEADTGPERETAQKAEEEAAGKRAEEGASKKSEADAAVKHGAQEGAAAKSDGSDVKGAKSSPKSPTRAQLLAKALRACKKVSKKQREQCEDVAHKRFGSRPKAKVKNKKGGRRK